MPLFATTLIILIYAAGLLLVGAALSTKTTSRIGWTFLLLVGLLLALPDLACVLYYAHLFDNAAWFYSFRTLPFAEFSVGGVGFIIGVLNSRFERQTLVEKLFAPAILLVLVTIPFVKPLLDPVDSSRWREHCDGEVCTQSTFSTCGPCSMATLLKFFGEDASEKQLAKECLTSRGGTEIWYIARAFRRRGFRTKVVIQKPQNLSLPTPSIAGVVLPGGAGHFIALLSESSGTVTIADPMKGKLLVKTEDLSRYYRFTGFFLAVYPKSS